MFCVIQEIETKKGSISCTFEHLEVTETKWSDGPTIYGYRTAGERFKRPIKKAYKISIHHSYREQGKVKKKQWVITTMGYYDLLEYWLGDCILQTRLNEKLEEMGITEKQLWDMVYIKLNPIINRTKAEFEQTEEYKVAQEQSVILSTYRKKKSVFESKYERGLYDCCYDVFGVLRNKEYKERLQEEYEARRKYQQRSYEESFNSNHNKSGGGSYQISSSSNYTKEEKKFLKKFYRVLAREFHPDINKDSGRAMVLVNKLKEQWEL
ncbi:MULTISPECIES: hypothetical protein [Bacillus cereus group]|uniref:J domain-containing protein n=1 Tax=Bacillus cereus (strain VD014) TaxID=1053223 RepID=A0A9W5NN43_BACC8|nr:MULTISPECIES: hypothetical protein [Bacillus cereus group]EJR16195.1 hypothetical protein IIA_04891 [Bacillus cereus VD014]MED3684173.1 hypothetical protein [Bacillus thuringiensis]PFT21593.1 hypothetical protein COK84_01050 [Bacillus thuringiensis]